MTTTGGAADEAASPDGPILPGALLTAWYIARRGAAESLRDRTSLLSSLFFALVLPAAMVLVLLGPQAAHGAAARREDALGTGLAVYLLIVGLMPSSSAISIAAGVFAGEKERGNLAPLLATPASNAAIFAGKILGAILPALLYATVAEATYLTGVVVVVGAGALRLLPAALSVTMVVLVPAVATMGATVASLISSRVRTYNSAQVLTSLAILPIMTALIGLAFAMQRWGVWSLAIAVAVLIALDALLIAVGATTWRREEVMAQR